MRFNSGLSVLTSGEDNKCLHLFFCIYSSIHFQQRMTWISLDIIWNSEVSLPSTLPISVLVFTRAWSPDISVIVFLVIVTKHCTPKHELIFIINSNFVLSLGKIFLIIDLFWEHHSVSKVKQSKMTGLLGKVLVSNSVQFIECLLHAINCHENQENFKVGKNFFSTSFCISRYLMQRSYLSWGNPTKMQRKTMFSALAVDAIATSAAFLLCSTEETKAQWD